MTSRWIDIPAFDRQTFKAWLALRPQTPRRAPAPCLVVLQEIWGVDVHIRAVAEQYASDGYVVLAPDPFWRMQPRVDLTYDEDGTKQAYGFRMGIGLDLAPSITVPMQPHLGDKDAHITPDHVAAIDAALAGHDNVRIDRYAAADHAFNCWARPSDRQQSATLAHGRSLAFFATHLGHEGQ